MRHPGSGPQHTLSPQPSLTDGRGERREGGGGGSGGCILTIPRSILSSLNLPSFLPSLYPIYPLSFSSQPLFLLPHPPSLLPLILHLSLPLSPLPLLHPAFSCPLYFLIPRFIPMLPAWRRGEKKNYTWGRQGSGRQAVPLVKVLDLG